LIDSLLNTLIWVLIVLADLMSVFGSDRFELKYFDPFLVLDEFSGIVNFECDDMLELID